jgi:hypothetical protein
MHIVIDLAQLEKGWVGSAIVPEFGVKGAPLVGLKVKDKDVEFGLKRALGAPTFKGHVEADGILKGEYEQGGNKTTFMLKRVSEAQVDLPEPSTPVSENLLGEWRGAFQLQTYKINVILKLANGTPGTPGGEMVIVEYGNQSYPISVWREEGNKIYLALESAGLTYEGEFQKDVSEIAGVLRQSYLPEMPLTLQRPATK